jgi:ribonuclease J
MNDLDPLIQEYNSLPGSDELLFLPLGGTGEIGMNFNLYGHAGKWIIIDCGITFDSELTDKSNIIIPDSSFIEEQRDNIVGLVLTHGHEDHIGAVQYLWRSLGCKIYATPFTARLLNKKLDEAGVSDHLDITVVNMTESIKLDPFDIQLITVTHSIPEPNAVFIRTSVGSVIHTGDWKLDNDPVLGKKTDENFFKKTGKDNILAMISDSTNALTSGSSGSEGKVRDSLMSLVAKFKTRVLISCFASNVARIQTIAEVAAANGRTVVLAGRSLWRITEVARESGYLSEIAPFVTEQESNSLPREKILIICTGSQGEKRAALTRISANQHSKINLEENDVVIFSSRIIPGNEISIMKLQNQLTRSKIKVITEKDAFVHVSGHPSRDDLTNMYKWVKPNIVVPVHGEEIHLHANSELAIECDVPFSPVIRNGEVLLLKRNQPEVVGFVKTGRLTVDGTELINVYSEILQTRRLMFSEGVVIFTIVVDQLGRVVNEPILSAPGITGIEDHDIELAEDIIDDVLEEMSSLPIEKLKDDYVLEEAIRRHIRKIVRKWRGKNPVIKVHLVRLTSK